MNTAVVAVEEYTRDKYKVIAVSGDLNVLNVREFENPLSHAVESSNNLVIDIRKVEYIDSAGIEQLIVAFSRLSEKSGSFGVLVSKGSQPDEVLHVIQLHTLTTVTSSPTELGLEE